MTPEGALSFCRLIPTARTPPDFSSASLTDFRKRTAAIFGYRTHLWGSRTKLGRLLFGSKIYNL
jgi:hypothetical protein